jgi:WD40 repeat protein
MLASSSEDKTVRLWDLKNGKTLRVLTGHTDFVWSVAFSADGRYLVAISDKQMIIWDLADLNAPTSRTIDGDFLSVAFAPKGRMLATGGYNGGAIVLWDATSGRRLGELAGHDDSVRSLAFSRNGKFLASGSDDTTVKVWNLARRSAILTIKGHEDWVNTLAWSGDDSEIVTGSRDGTIKLWGASNGKHIRDLAATEGVKRAAKVLPDGRTLAVGGDATEIRLFDIATGTELEGLRTHSYYVTSIAASKSGKFLAVGSGDAVVAGHGDIVRIWDPKDGVYVGSLAGHESYISAVAFSPDEKLLASGSADGTIKVWDTAAMSVIATTKVEAGTITALAYSPDGDTIASTHFDGSVRTWNTRADLRAVIAEPSGRRFRSLVFSPDGGYLAALSWLGEVKIWKADNGAAAADRPRSWAVFPDNSEVAVSRNGGQLVARREGAHIEIRNANTDTLLCTLFAVDDNDWVTVDPQGRFDTSKPLDDIKGLHWIFDDDIQHPLSIDVFMRQYYEPGLLRRRLRCHLGATCSNEFKPLPPIAGLNRVQSTVGLADVKRRDE